MFTSWQGRKSNAERQIFCIEKDMMDFTFYNNMLSSKYYNEDEKTKAKVGNPEDMPKY
jgi:hypothetical protein